MKILILNWRDIKHPLAGGAERVTLTYAESWVNQGWEVIWLAGGYKNSKQHETVKGIKIYRYGNAYTIYLLAALVYWFKFGGKFDLVIDEIHGIPFFSPLWAFRSKKIAFIHEVAQEIWDRMYSFPINLIGKFIEKLYFKFYKHIPFMTVSESTKDDLTKFGIPAKNITVFPNGIAINSVNKFKKKEKKLTLIFVARLVKMKGIEDALSLFSQIEAKQANSQFWIVGAGESDYIKKLQEMVSSLNLEKKVKFLGYVDEKKKNILYQKAHFLIHTSIREGFGLVVLEANLQGTPAIVYNSPGLKDVVKNSVNGYRIEVGKLTKMAEKILSLYNNKNEYNKLSKKSLVYVREFSWDKITNNITKYIKKIV